MDRRKFIASSGLLASASLIPNQTFAGVQQEQDIIKPMRLQKGNTIGMITPASAVNRYAFEKSVENLESFGFKVKYSDNMNVKKGFLAGTDQQRLDDLHAMFEDPDVHGIMCARGGYGSGRLLRDINYDLIKANPKALIGYSDITALHMAIHSQTGLVTFHGPVGASKYSKFTAKGFDEVLVKARPVTFQRPKAWDKAKEKLVALEGLDEEKFEAISDEKKTLVKIWKDPLFKGYTVSEGIAEGALVGGNLTLVCSVMGTPYDLSFDNKIVFLEDIGESPYRVDRMLTQLLNAGKFDNCVGIALGVFKGCDVKPDDPDFALSTGLDQVMMDRFKALDIPIVYGLPIGHIDDNATLPMGISAQLDTEKRTLKLLEAGVV